MVSIPFGLSVLVLSLCWSAVPRSSNCLDCKPSLEVLTHCLKSGADFSPYMSMVLISYRSVDSLVSQPSLSV